MKGWLIRAQQPRSKLISCKGQHGTARVCGMKGLRNRERGDGGGAYLAQHSCNTFETVRALQVGEGGVK